MSAIIVLTTVPGDFDANGLARVLVEQRVAACVNVLPAVRSFYWWKEAVAEETEQLLLIKTAETRLDELKQTLFAMHPYKIAEFVVLKPDQLSEAYRTWLEAAVAEA